MLSNKKFTFFILEYTFSMLCNKKTRNFFREDFFVSCSGFASSLLKYMFFKLEAGKFHFQRYQKFFHRVLFYFPSLEYYFLKYKKNIRLKSSISRNIRIIFGVDFLFFQRLGLKLSQTAAYYTTLVV